MTTRVVAVLVALAILGAGCKSSPPDPLTLEATQTVTATVESIDMAKRLISLRAADGSTATVETSPEVRNLAQVRIGDQVVVRYHQAMAAELKPKGESSTLGAVAGADDVVRRQAGDKPGGAAATTVTTTVVIDAVDQSSNTVVFRGPNGMLRTVSVVDPKARKFISHLKKGDEVEVTYTEALAVSVEPAG